MKKILRLLGIVALLGCGAMAEAQQPGKVPRIGFLVDGSPSSHSTRIEAFRQGLFQLGYVEGKNIAIEYRYAEGRFDRVPVLAGELVRLKVDVILTSGPSATAAKQATGTIPIVFVAVPDPVGGGLVDSLARPGGNITGLTNINVELAGKRLELLKETFPRVSRVAVIRDPNSSTAALSWRELEVAAKVLGVQLQSLEVRAPDDFAGAFRSATRKSANALIVLSSPLIVDQRKRIADLALKNRLPSMFASSEYTDAGGLMSYGPNIPEQYHRAATYVDKILKGTKPADLPVEQPMKFELVINLKAAKQIGLTIPQSVLFRADKVIK